MPCGSTGGILALLGQGLNELAQSLEGDLAQGKLYQLEGIVLGRRDQGEADRVIMLLAPSGRVDLLARGVRKLRSRKAGHLELFSRTRLLVSRVKGSWDIISQAEAQVIYPRLQEDFELGTYARYVAELALRFFTDEPAEGDIFNLVSDVLALLNQGGDADRCIRWYEQQLLSLAGYQPEWRSCVGELESGRCGKSLQPRPDGRQKYGVAPELGGALCAECLVSHQGVHSVRRLSPSALSWLQALQSKPYAELRDYAFPESTAAELRSVMEAYIAYHLEHRPMALRVLRSINRHKG